MAISSGVARVAEQGGQAGGKGLHQGASVYSGPCDERPPLLRSLGGLSWGCGLISGCKMYKKYYLMRTRGGHIRQVGLILGGLLSQGPLY